MKVIADSQAILWYVTDDSLLSKTAGAALDEAVENEGVGVAAAGLLDLWYATHKKGDSQVKTEHYEYVKSVLDDEDSNVELLPFAGSTIPHSQSIPWADMKDPFDRMIVAAALEYELPLVTSDKLITSLGVVPVIW